MGAIVLDLRPGLGIGPFSLGILFSRFLCSLCQRLDFMSVNFNYLHELYEP